MKPAASNVGLRVCYDTAELNRQWPVIAKSRLDATRRIISEDYLRATRLSLDDPPELWRFVIGRSEPRFPPLAPQEKDQAKLLVRRIRELDPEFIGDLEVRDAIGKPTFRDTVLSLANQFTDQATLAKHIATLLRLYQRGPLTQADFKAKSKFEDNSTRILVQHWIQDPPGERWTIASLCFYSDLALAKMVYFLARKKWLPEDPLKREAKRIEKLRNVLGLVPARPRIIRDIEFKFGKVHYHPIAARLKRL
jgi:hypothetical protein